MSRHWSEADFVVTSTSPAYDGSECPNRFGYCRKCKADMQSFGATNGPGPLKHYHSHMRAKALGIWGKTIRLQPPPKTMRGLYQAKPAQAQGNEVKP